MGRIPEATIQEIRDRADIVGVIGRYVDLKQAGRSWKGLCPFHEEKTPSFNVNPDRQIFHCFGCEVGGDVLSFFMRYENLSFPEAARLLAGQLGIAVPEEDGGERGERECLYAALEQAQRFYRETLDAREGEAARRYLAQRGLAAGEFERFGLGFAPTGWDGLAKALRRAEIADRVSLAAGLLCERQSGGFYDRLRTRVTFPIRDVSGRVVAFGGRATGEGQEPKYLNTPETALFKKGRTFYGLPAALEPIRRNGRAIVCEGYFDVIALCRAELGEALATCGTALTPEHARQLARRTPKVSLLFDADAAGEKAMERALAVLLSEGLRVRAVRLPAGDDPDDFLVQYGAKALRERVDTAPDAIDAVLRKALAMGCSTPAEKADVVHRVVPLVAAVADAIERGEYAQRVALASGTDAGAVAAMVAKAAGGEGVHAAKDAGHALVGPRRAIPEQRHLHLLALIASRYPGEFTALHCERLREVVPEGPWKSLVFRLIEAAAEGCLNDRGAVDVPALESQLTREEAVRLREVSVDDLLVDGELSVAKVLTDLLERFEARHRERQEREIRQRMQDPQEDALALLRERQSLLERKRAAQRLGTRA